MLLKPTGRPEPVARSQPETDSGQFLMLPGYYRRFVKNFAELADPLVALTRKGVPFMWGSDQQKAFDALKVCLLSAPILGFPTEEDRFVLDMDASLFAIGGVLNQVQRMGRRW